MLQDLIVSLDMPMSLRILVFCVILFGGSYLITKIVFWREWNPLFKPFLIFGLITLLFIPMFVFGFKIFWIVT